MAHVYTMPTRLGIRDVLIEESGISNYACLNGYLASLADSANREAFITDLIAVLEHNVSGGGVQVEPKPTIDAYFDFLAAQREHEADSVIRPALPVSSNTELILLILLCYKYARIHKPRMCWLAIDLPAGVGKSYAIEKVYNEIDPKPSADKRKRSVVISTPTSQAAATYANGLAFTINSNFMIKGTNDSRFSPDNEAARRLINNGSLFVFEEFSMYGQHLLVGLLQYLAQKNKMVVLIGDSFQMPPVRQPQINWYNQSNYFLRQFPFAAFVINHHDITIERICPTAPAEFRLLWLDLRKLVQKNMCFKHQTTPLNSEPQKQPIANGPPTKKQKTASSSATTHKAPRWKMTPECVRGWIERFSMAHIVDTLTTEDALIHIERKQNQLLALVENLRNVGFFDSSQYSPDFFKNRGACIIKEQIDMCGHPLTNIPIFVGYENALNNKIIKLVDERCGIKMACHGRNVVFGERFVDTERSPTLLASSSTSELPERLCPVLLQSELWYEEVVQGISKAFPLSLTSIDNQFYPGMLIRCRENAAKENVYNNQAAMFLTFYVEQPWLFETIKTCTFTCLNTFVKDAANKLVVPEHLTRIKIRGDSDDEFMAAARSIYMVAIDIKTSKLLRIRPSIKYLCALCETNECPHHRAATNRARFLYFNWTTNYSGTMYYLQGKTLPEEKLFLVSKHVFKTHLQRSIYMLITRCKHPDQLIADVAFIKHALRIVFNVPFADVEKFLVKNGIEIKANTTLDRLVC